MAVERIELEADTDLREILERVHDDRQPRIIERDGEPLAMVVPPSEEDAEEIPKSRKHRDEFMSYAGVWKDLDVDEMIRNIYEWRHQSPPSPPPPEF